MKITIVILVLAFLCGCKKDNNSVLVVSSMNELIKLDTVIDTGIEYSPELSEGNRIAFHHDSVWVLTGVTKGEIKFNVADLMTHTVTKQSYWLPDSISENNVQTVEDIDVNDRFVCVLFSKLVVAIPRNSMNNTIPLLVKDITSEPYMQCRIRDDIIYLARCYNYHPNTTSTPVHIISLQVPSGNIIDSCSPAFSGIEFTHFFVNRLFDVSPSAKSVVFSQTIKYELNIYDGSLKNPYTIKSNNFTKPMDTSVLTELHKGSRLNPRDIIKKLKPHEKSGAERIRYVKFLSDSLLLVAYRAASSEAFNQRITYYDIWNKSGNEWKILHHKKEMYPDKNVKFTKDQFPLMASYKGMPVMSNHYAVQLVASQPVSTIFAPDKTFGDYLNDQDDAFSKFMTTPINYHFFVYRFDL